MQDYSSQSRRMMPMKWLIAVGVFVSVGFGGICWGVLEQMGQRDREMARVGTANIVASLGSEISRNIEMYDLSLQAAADGIRTENIYLVPPALRQMILFDRSATAQGLGTIMVLDREGNVVVESRTSAIRRTNYAGRDYFQVHKYNPDSGRYVSGPWLTARGEYVIGISRRLVNDSGDFTGVVIGTMKLDYLRGLFEKIKRKPGDSLSLVRENGTLIMRAPFETRVIGQNVSSSTIFQKIAGRETGFFEAFAGLDSTRRLYAFERLKDLPFVLSYGSSLETLYADWWEQAWRIGAIVLALCLVNLALVVFLARSLRRSGIAERTLQKMATTDALTGLANRRRFDQVIELEWNRARRTQEPISLLMIDADHFKSYNDTLGHQAGDTALAAIADCIAHATRRAGECGARYGGEEFAVILPGATIEQAKNIAASIIDRVNDLRARDPNPLGGIPTVSIGVATLVPQAGMTTRDLIKAADAALYQAKESGRARCVASASPLALLARKMAA